MGERCELCKMDVSSLKMHRKINHKKLKFSKGKIDVGFKPGTSVVQQVDETKVCTECNLAVKNLDQHMYLSHTKRNLPQSPASTNQSPTLENIEKRKCESEKFLEELLKSEKKQKREGIRRRGKRRLSSENSHDLTRMSTYRLKIMNLHSSSKIRIFNCPECGVNVYCGCVGSEKEKLQVLRTLCLHLQQCREFTKKSPENTECMLDLIKFSICENDMGLLAEQLSLFKATGRKPIMLTTVVMKTLSLLEPAIRRSALLAMNELKEVHQIEKLGQLIKTMLESCHTIKQEIDSGSEIVDKCESIEVKSVSTSASIASISDTVVSEIKTVDGTSDTVGHFVKIFCDIKEEPTPVEDCLPDPVGIQL